jgi:hypothetical protein
MSPQSGSVDGRLNARGSRASEIEHQIDAAAEASKFREAKSLGDVVSRNEKGGVRTLHGVTFERRDGVWVDARVLRSLRPAGRALVVRAYGEAYFALARRSTRLAEWFKLGERVRVLLPGYVLEVAPDGAESLTEVQLDKIASAANTM